MMCLCPDPFSSSPRRSILVSSITSTSSTMLEDFSEGRLCSKLLETLFGCSKPLWLNKSLRCESGTCMSSISSQISSSMNTWTYSPRYEVCLAGRIGELLGGILRSGILIGRFFSMMRVSFISASTVSDSSMLFWELVSSKNRRFEFLGFSFRDEVFWLVSFLGVGYVSWWTSIKSVGCYTSLSVDFSSLCSSSVDVTTSSLASICRAASETYSWGLCLSENDLIDSSMSSLITSWIWFFRELIDCLNC